MTRLHEATLRPFADELHSDVSYSKSSLFPRLVEWLEELGAFGIRYVK